jgi:hypothetical protein
MVPINAKTNTATEEERRKTGHQNIDGSGFGLVYCPLSKSSPTANSKLMSGSVIV